MAKNVPSTRQRAIALAALLADDQALEPLERMAPRLTGPAIAMARDILESPATERRRSIGREVAFLLRDQESSNAPKVGLAPGLRKLCQRLGSPPRAATEAPRALAALRGTTAEGVLEELTTSLLLRAARGDDDAARIISSASPGEDASHAPATVAPALEWLALALADDEATAEALASSWSPELGHALLDSQAGHALSATTEQAARARAHLEQELRAGG